jgi:hypothetical protein
MVLDDLLPRVATESGSWLRGEPPCSPMCCCGDDQGEMIRRIRTVGSRRDSRAAHAGSGLPAEYGKLTETFAPEALSAMRDFILGLR